MRALIDAVFGEPDASASVLAARLGCSAQTVRRYRWLSERRGYTQQGLSGLNDQELDQLFNRRSRAPTTREPDFEALFAGPRIPVRQAWLDYRRRDPSSAMSWTYFAKRHAAARKQHRRQVLEKEGAADQLIEDTGQIVKPERGDYALEFGADRACQVADPD
jgi:hypothetical protein